MSNNIYSISLRLRKIYIDDKQVYYENYPQPINLEGLLEQYGYTMAPELKGWISPAYEQLILDNIENYLLSEDGKPKTENLIPLGKINKKELTETISKFLLSKKNNLSFKEYEILTWGIENLELNFPNEIHNKLIIRIALDSGKGATSVTSINDILETITWPFRPGTRRNKFVLDKKRILNLLETYLNTKPDYSDAKKYLKTWKLLGKLLHVNHKKYPETRKFFDKIMGKDKTWAKKAFWSKIQRVYDKAEKTGSIIEAVKLFSQKPEEFIKRIDSLYRKAWEIGDLDGSNMVLDNIMTIQNIRPEILINLIDHFINREEDIIERSYTNNLGRKISYRKPLKAMNYDMRSIMINMLSAKLKNVWGENKIYKNKKIYIDIPEEMSFITKNNRLISDLVPGQIINFKDKHNLRIFLQWIDNYGNQDLELLAHTCDENLKSFDTITCHRSNRKFIVHSGNIGYTKGKCTEFIDIDLDNLLKTYNDLEWMIVFAQNNVSEKLSDVESYIGMSVVEKNIFRKSKHNTIFKTKIDLDKKSIIGFLINLTDGYAKLIMKGISEKASKIALSEKEIKNFIYPKQLLPLMKEYVMANDGVIVEEKTKADIILTKNDWDIIL